LNNLTFLSAQPLSTYFLWQTAVCVQNLLDLGVEKKCIHLLFTQSPQQQRNTEDDALLLALQGQASVYFYADIRASKNYLSSIRPHILAKHFQAFPALETEAIFYHDCDIIFRELPPILSKLPINTWYVSDTANYLDTHYIKRHIGESGFLQMCALVGISPAAAMAQDAHCGGAQYVLQNVSVAFWQKVEKDSEGIYTLLEKLNRENKMTAFGYSIFHYGH